MLELSEIFDLTLGARPATYTTDAADENSYTAEIAVAFSREEMETYGAQNAGPVAWARTTDVPGISNASTLIIHYGYLQDERGEIIKDESGEPIIAENEYSYKVTRVHTDAYGVTKIELSFVSP